MDTCEAPVPQPVAELQTTNPVTDTADNDQTDQTFGTINQTLCTTETLDDTATNDTNSDTIEASPIPSIKSLGSGGDFEEPLTPFTDVSSKSETSRSQTGSGRVTLASQSDQSVCMSSTEKSTPSKKRKSTDTQGRQIDFEPQPQAGRVPTTLIHRSVKFPFRAGIHWKKGEKLEAMDFMHKCPKSPQQVQSVSSSSNNERDGSLISSAGTIDMEDLDLDQINNMETSQICPQSSQSQQESQDDNVENEDDNDKELGEDEEESESNLSAHDAIKAEMAAMTERMKQLQNMLEKNTPKSKKKKKSNSNDKQKTNKSSSSSSSKTSKRPPEKKFHKKEEGISSRGKIIEKPANVVLTWNGTLVDLDKLPSSRSGRLIKPPLCEWAGQQLCRGENGYYVTARTECAKQYCDEIQNTFWNSSTRMRNQYLKQKNKESDTSDTSTTRDVKPSPLKTRSRTKSSGNSTRRTVILEKLNSDPQKGQSRRSTRISKRLSNIVEDDSSSEGHDTSLDVVDKTVNESQKKQSTTQRGRTKSGVRDISLDKAGQEVTESGSELNETVVDDRCWTTADLNRLDEVPALIVGDAKPAEAGDAAKYDPDCEECNKEYDMDCPVHGPLDFIQDKEVSMVNDPDRALHTLPDGFVVKESSIIGAGLGVFTEKEIPPRTKFGPYGGVRVTDQTKAHKSGYCWQVYENGKPSHFVDAQDKTTANWMRYVNCAVSETDQNLVAFQYKGAIYYRTYRPILPGQELLVWYGDEYARELGLVRDKNLLFRPSYVNGEVYFPCVFCKTAFTAASYCVRHLMRAHGRDKLKAEDIQVLDTWLRQNKHYRYSTESQQERSKKSYSCDNSDGAGENSVMTQEMCTDKKLYKCDFCGYASNRKDNLITHKRIHTGDKPYKCDICCYASNNKGHLTRHRRIHTGEKPYKCDICGYASNNKGNLITHKRIHTGERPYKCDVCGYACNLKQNLITHKRIHTGERPYKCDVCGYTCNQKQHLITHKRIHTDEKI